MQSEDGTGHGVEWRTRGEAVFSYARNGKHARGGEGTVQGGNRGGAWTRSSAVARPAMHSPSLCLFWVRMFGHECLRLRWMQACTASGEEERDGRGEGGSGHAAIALYEPDTTAMHSLHGGGQLGSFSEAPVDRQTIVGE